SDGAAASAPLSVGAFARSCAPEATAFETSTSAPASGAPEAASTTMPVTPGLRVTFIGAQPELTTSASRTRDERWTTARDRIAVVKRQTAASRKRRAETHPRRSRVRGDIARAG